MSYCVACLLKLFMWLLQQLRCSRPPFPILPRGKTGLAEYPILLQNQTLSGPCTDVQNIYIYTYTHYYNCIYALLVPRCILDHLSVYVCFLAELAQHLQYIGMNITISSTPWPAHLATSPLQIGWKRNEFESFRVRFFTKKTGKEMEQLTAYNHKNWWQHPTALWVSRDRKTPRKTAPGAIPGATTRARTNFFQRRVALRQLCKASSKCATKARIISETYTSWLSWRSWLSWLLTF